MRISVDAGALCQTQKTGNFTFTENLLKALFLYDKTDDYIAYTFCRENISKENIKYRLLQPSFGFLKLRIAIEELINKKDIFLALNQGLPLFGPNKIISFCHGLSYYFFPQYYSKHDVCKLKKQLALMISKSNKIIVSSVKVKDELISIFPKNKNIVVLPFGIPYDVSDRQPVSRKEKLILVVGAGQKIKNIDFIIKSFDILKQDKDFQDYKLVLVGDKNKPLREELTKLYSKASALLTASHYESFNFPVLEALTSGCPVIGLDSAIIPELKQYVVVTNKENFIEKVKQTIISPPAIDYDKLKKEFSWREYINNLIELY